MDIIDFSKTNSVINLYMSELRDKNYQRNRYLFRHNIKRVGEMMAYELSKSLEYKPKTVTTPLGTLEIPLPKEDLLIATVLRAGLPFHEGFLDVFDHAENAFVSAYRMYTNREHTEVGVHTEYLAAPSAKGKTLVIVDPMLATGGSMAASIEALVKTGKPKKIHIACALKPSFMRCFKVAILLISVAFLGCFIMFFSFKKDTLRGLDFEFFAVEALENLPLV